MKSIACLSVSLAISLGLLSVAQAEGKYVEPKIAHASYGAVKIVVPISSSDPKVWGFKMGNIRSALAAADAWGGKLTIEVVTYGGAVLLLAQKEGDIADAVRELRTRGVQFAVCNNSLRAGDIDFHTLAGVADADVVPSGFLEVAWLQTQGYVLDPAN